jgi:hypothetical protein
MLSLHGPHVIDPSVIVVERSTAGESDELVT